eukprot:9328637-Pyramimonas_sp.AAC.1
MPSGKRQIPERTVSQAPFSEPLPGGFGKIRVNIPGGQSIGLRGTLMHHTLDAADHPRAILDQAATSSTTRGGQKDCATPQPLSLASVWSTK